MAHPKRQHSRQRSRKRRTHQRLTASIFAGLSASGNKMGLAHRVCPITGCYKGEQVAEIVPRVKKA